MDTDPLVDLSDHQLIVCGSDLDHSKEVILNQTLVLSDHDLFKARMRAHSIEDMREI
jgi:hypothetical protein